MSNVGPNAEDTGNTQQTQNNQQEEGGQQQQQQKGENNGQNNDDKFEDLWQDTDSNKDKTQQQQTQQTQQPGSQQAPDADKAFSTYIEGLDLSKDIDLAKVSEDLNQGNTESLGKAFSSIAAKTYRQAMIDMNKIIDQKVTAGVEAAVSQSSNAAQGTQAVRQMNTLLDFTKNPAIAPVAGAVLAQLMKKGKSVDDAVEGVRKFFQNTSKISAKALGLQNPPRGRPGNQPFSNVGDTGGDDDDETDWLETLGV